MTDQEELKRINQQLESENKLLKEHLNRCLQDYQVLKQQINKVLEALALIKIKAYIDLSKIFEG